MKRGTAKRKTLSLLIVLCLLLSACAPASAPGSAAQASGMPAETAAPAGSASENSAGQTAQPAPTGGGIVYNKRIGVGATAWYWYYQKYWLDTNVSWDKLDPVSFLAGHGFDWLRVEVWMQSAPELDSGPPYPPEWLSNYFGSRELGLQVMKAGAENGMKICLMMSLNDTGACGSNQKAPAAWADYTLEQTADALREYTYATAKYYLDHGIKVDLYEIGNEIEFGVCGYSNDTKLALPGVNYLADVDAVRKGIWEKEAVLLKAAIEGVRQADPQAKTVLHISPAQWPAVVEGFFEAMVDFGVPFDYGGLSYYEWCNPHPTIPSPENPLDLCVDAIAKLGKKTVICEYSYPSTDNPMEGFEVKAAQGYPFTQEGQAEWVRDFLARAETDDDIEAVFYYNADYYLDSNTPNSALFMDDSHPKPALFEFARFQDDSADSVPPVIASVKITPEKTGNGGNIRIVADCGESHIYAEADIHELDNTQIDTIPLLDAGNGTYAAEITVGPGNSAQNGSKTVLITAKDVFGNTSAATARVSLENAASAKPPGLDDSFDGKTLDNDKWIAEAIEGGEIGQDGKLLLKTSGEKDTSLASVKSNWCFDGDFDMQVDYSLGEGWVSPEKGHLTGGIFGVEINGTQYQIGNLLRAGSDNILIVWDSSAGILKELPCAAASGKLRLARAENTISFLYDTGNGWRRLASQTVGGNPATVVMSNTSIGAAHRYAALFDNFIVNEGSVAENRDR